ncbi:MAG: hypothetical protein BGO09_11090 [Bacteroidetes bacterium 47-18]|nr:MAG: hypothetical protein BGO09_11090 [Bacteroidetes bacterium 47-18]
MRSPNRQRPLPNKLTKNPNVKHLEAIKDKVSYVGSVEHKDAPSRLIEGKIPRPRPDASMCPRWINDLDLVNKWLKIAFEKGAVCDYFEGDFPRYVWFKYENTVFMGRLINKESGEYKGFPINQFEWPPGINKIYAE